MDDQEIIQSILSGDQNAYALLVRKYQNRIYSHCVSMLSDFSLAQDAVQEVFIKAYQSLNKFRAQSTFYTWLYRIASNHCLDILRKKSRNKSESWESLLEKKGEKIHELLTAEKPEKSRSERRELIESVLAQLNPDYRVILVLREIDGLSYDEISQTLNCSLDAVKARLKRARQDFEMKLRHFWGSENVK